MIKNKSEKNNKYIPKHKKIRKNKFIIINKNSKHKHIMIRLKQKDKKKKRNKKFRITVNNQFICKILHE